MAEEKYSFTASEDFWSDETQSQYIKGLSYTMRGADRVALAKEWTAQGKVTEGRPAARMSGGAAAVPQDKET